MSDQKLVRVTHGTVSWTGYLHDESDTHYLVWSSHTHAKHWIDKSNVKIC